MEKCGFRSRGRCTLAPPHLPLPPPPRLRFDRGPIRLDNRRAIRASDSLCAAQRYDGRRWPKNAPQMHILNQNERIMWECGPKCGPLYFTVDRNEFTGAPRRNIHDCLWPRGFPPLPPLFLPPLSRAFMHSRGSRKQPRRSLLGKIKKGGGGRTPPDHCSSSLAFSTFLRDATFIPRGNAGSFLEVTTHPVSTHRVVRAPARRKRGREGGGGGWRQPYGTRRRADGGRRRHGALHYNYNVKKFKSLNTVRPPSRWY